MKPRTIFQKQVSASNAGLTEISPKAIEWATRKLIQAPAFRTKKGTTTCGNCGHSFNHKGKGSSVVCPHCGRRLAVKDTAKRTLDAKTYFATLEAVDGIQVQRVFQLNVSFRKGVPVQTSHWEVCRMWLGADGKTAVTSRAGIYGGYCIDSFNRSSEIELRQLQDHHIMIADSYVYPRYKAIPELRRNGLKGKLPDCHPFKLMKALLTDPRIETLMKSGDNKGVEHFIEKPRHLDACWESLKVAMRHGYRIEDYGMWCDLVSLLEVCGKDTRSPRYICPLDLNAEHDRWCRKADRIRNKKREEEQLMRARRDEADFIKKKSCYFGIVIKDKDIEVSVLNSIEAYKREGDAMHHCVFSCEYYNHDDSIVLSAHDRDGKRIETVEFSLTENKVVQSRGVNNGNTKYHDRIVRLVNANAHLFMKAKATA